jgi:L-ascorbate metabolism protein UlaG (beta-lactamase superfamily)
MRATWLGHSTVLFEEGGARLLTDPLLRERLLHLRRHGPVPRVGPVDAVLLSHLHLDHADILSLESLDRGARIVLPRGGGELVAGRGFAGVEEVAVGDTVRVGGATVRAVPARHLGRRTPLPHSPRADALGYLIEGERRTWFAGDTDLFDTMPALAPVDLALVPIWGWGPRLGSGHLNPRSAAEALARVRPRVAVAIHHGTYSPLLPRGRPPYLDGPLARFVEEAARQAPETEVRPLRPGEATEV